MAQTVETENYNSLLEFKDKGMIDVGNNIWVEDSIVGRRQHMGYTGDLEKSFKGDSERVDFREYKVREISLFGVPMLIPYIRMENELMPTSIEKSSGLASIISDKLSGGWNFGEPLFGMGFKDYTQNKCFNLEKGYLSIQLGIENLTERRDRPPLRINFGYDLSLKNTKEFDFMKHGGAREDSLGERASAGIYLSTDINNDNIIKKLATSNGLKVSRTKNKWVYLELGHRSSSGSTGDKSFEMKFSNGRVTKLEEKGLVPVVNSDMLSKLAEEFSSFRKGGVSYKDLALASVFPNFTFENEEPEVDWGKTLGKVKPYLMKDKIPVDMFKGFNVFEFT